MQATASIEPIVDDVRKQTTIQAGTKALFSGLERLFSEPSELKATIKALNKANGVVAEALIENTPQAKERTKGAT